MCTKDTRRKIKKWMGFSLVLPFSGFLKIPYDWSLASRKAKSSLVISNA